MLTWLKNFLGIGRNKQIDTNGQNLDLEVKIKVKNTNFYYRPNLIPNLLVDHKKIFHYYAGIQKSFKANDARGVVKNLQALTDTLKEHLLKEDTMLYTYLQQFCKDTQEQINIVKNMKNEMMGIEKTLFAFVVKYSNIKSWRPSDFAELEKDMAELTPVLITRIDTEEKSLYSLYKIPN